MADLKPNVCGPTELAKWQIIEDGPSILQGSWSRIVEHTTSTGHRTRYWVSFNPNQWGDAAGFSFQRRHEPGTSGDWTDVSVVPAGVMWHALVVLQITLGERPEPAPRIPSGAFGPESVKDEDNHIEMNVWIGVEAAALNQLAERAAEVGRRAAIPAEGEVHNWALGPPTPALEPPPPPPVEDCQTCVFRNNHSDCSERVTLDSNGECVGYMPF